MTLREMFLHEWRTRLGQPAALVSLAAFAAILMFAAMSARVERDARAQAIAGHETQRSVAMQEWLTNLKLLETRGEQAGVPPWSASPMDLELPSSLPPAHRTFLDGALDVKLTTPKELGGGGGAGNNPEQLFAAGYAAGFIGAMKFVASQGGPKVPADATVTSTVGIGPRSEGGFGLDIDLAVSLPGLPKAEAEALVAKAHQVCPYSNATRGNVDVRLTVV